MTWALFFQLLPRVLCWLIYALGHFADLATRLSTPLHRWAR